MKSMNCMEIHGFHLASMKSTDSMESMDDSEIHGGVVWHLDGGGGVEGASAEVMAEDGGTMG